MRQTLHIFLKDLRHLWPRLTVLLLLIAANAYYDTRVMPVDIPETARLHTISMHLTIVLTIAICFVIAALVFDEGLADDRAFWITRPYAWQKLLAAKVFTLLLFFNIPLFLSDCYILSARHFAVLGVFPQLLLRQVLLAAFFILPSFAIATVTSGFAQFLLAWLALPVVVFAEMTMESLFSDTHDMMMVPVGSSLIATVLVTACGVVLWQYARRSAVPARIAMLAVAFAFLPAMWGYSRLAGSHPANHPTTPSDIRVFYDPERPPSSIMPGDTPPEGFVTARIPLGVEGLAPDTLLEGSATLSINVNGSAWPHPGYSTAASVRRIAGQYWQEMNVARADLAYLEHGPANLRATFWLTVVSDSVEARIPLGRPAFMIPGVGTCQTFQQQTPRQIACIAGLDSGIRTAIRMDGPGGYSQLITEVSPPSIPWGLSPTSLLGVANEPEAPAGTELSIIPRHQLASFERTITLNGIELGKYVLSR